MYELYLALHVMFFALVVYYLFSNGYMSIYSGLFVYVVFHFVAFVQRPVVVYVWDIRSEFIFMNFMPTEGQLAETMLISDIGLLSFAIAYIAALRGQMPRQSFEMQPPGQPENNALFSVFLVLAPLMAYSFFLAFTMRQVYDAEALDELGRLNIQVDPATGQHLFADTTAYLVFARNMAFPFATAFAIVKRGTWWSFLPMALCAIIALQVGERWPVVIGLLVAMLCALYLRKRAHFSLWQYGAMAAILVVFMIVGQNRAALLKFLQTGDFDVEFDLMSSSLGAYPDFANFEFLSYVVAKVPAASKTYTYFTQYAGLFTQPIPRMLWPDKPVGSPINLINLENYGHFASRSTSLVGDGWMSFGYPGVVLTMGLVGFFYGRIYKRFCQPNNSIYLVCAYLWVVALLLQWARDGGIRIFDFLFFCTGPILLAWIADHFVLRARSRTRSVARRV